MEIKIKNDGLLNGSFLTTAQQRQIDLDVPKMYLACASCTNCAFFEYDDSYCRAFDFNMEQPGFLRCNEHSFAKNDALKEIVEIMEVLTERTIEAMEDF